MPHVSGKFTVKSTPLDPTKLSEQLGLMQMKFEKKFEGALSAEGLVCMMGIMNQASGSGGYVAMEKITGELEGKLGSFFFQHSSVMNKGIPKQSITVVPGSGCDALAGLSGELTIHIKEGQHFYEFRYEI